MVEDFVWKCLPSVSPTSFHSHVSSNSDLRDRHHALIESVMIDLPHSFSAISGTFEPNVPIRLLFWDDPAIISQTIDISGEYSYNEACLKGSNQAGVLADSAWKRQLQRMNGTG